VHRCKDGGEKTYSTKSVLDLLEGGLMYGLRLVSTQNRIAGIHPSQGCTCSEVDVLCFESSNACVKDDPET
jgi:hypothetical protein